MLCKQKLDEIRLQIKIEQHAVETRKLVKRNQLLLFFRLFNMAVERIGKCTEAH